MKKKTDTWESLIDLYLTKILKTTVYKLNTKVYIFLDEIQLIPLWQSIIKRYYDFNPNLKFIVTGSSSFSNRENKAESLAGRVFERYLPPLTFDEYCLFSKRDDEDQNKKINYLKEAVVRKVMEVNIPKNGRLKKFYEFEQVFVSS